jgi:hypothetical protein
MLTLMLLWPIDVFGQCYYRKDADTIPQTPAAAHTLSVINDLTRDDGTGGSQRPVTRTFPVRYSQIRGRINRKKIWWNIGWLDRKN